MKRKNVSWVNGWHLTGSPSAVACFWDNIKLKWALLRACVAAKNRKRAAVEAMELLLLFRAIRYLMGDSGQGVCELTSCYDTMMPTIREYGNYCSWSDVALTDFSKKDRTRVEERARELMDSLSEIPADITLRKAVSTGGQAIRKGDRNGGVMNEHPFLLTSARFGNLNCADLREAAKNGRSRKGRHG